jgi:WD40 repeat protein
MPARLTRRSLLAAAALGGLGACGGEDRPRPRPNRAARPVAGRPVRSADVRGLRLLRRLPLGDSAELVGIAFRPGGGEVAVGDGVGVLRGAPIRGGDPTVLADGDGRVWGVAVRRDGRLAWADGAGVLRIEGRAPVRQAVAWVSVAWAPRGDVLAAGSDDGRIVILRGSDRRELRGHDLAVLGLARHPRTGRLASSDQSGSARVWPHDGGDPIRLDYEKADFGADMNGLTWLHEPHRLATASQDGIVRLWDVVRRRVEHRLEGADGWSRPVALSPAGDLLASSGVDGVIRLWDPETGARRAAVRGDGTTVWGLAWSPDGRALVSAGADGALRVYGLPG